MINPDDVLKLVCQQSQNLVAVVEKADHPWHFETCCFPRKETIVVLGFSEIVFPKIECFVSTIGYGHQKIIILPCEAAKPIDSRDHASFQVTSVSWVDCTGQHQVSST